MSTLKIGRVLYSKKDIQERIKKLARDIADDYKPIFQGGNNDFCLVLIGILNGAIFFVSNLAQALSKYFPPGTIRVDFIRISSYDNSDQQKGIRLLADTKESVKGLYVLVIEDIVDTGSTIKYVKDLLEAKGAKDVKVCTLIERWRGRENSLVDYRGFTCIQKNWLIGYGLDSGGCGRELPFVATLSDS